MSDLSHIFGGSFDGSQYDKSQVNSPLPPNDYPYLIESAEVKNTKNGDGKYIELVLSVIEGQCKGRKVWDNINIENQSAKCTAIGRAHLDNLREALNIEGLSNTDQLVRQSVIGETIVDKDGNNRIKKFKSIQNSFVATPQTPATTQAPTGNKPPWLNK